MNFDEGTAYFTITPSDSNPFVTQISGFRSGYEWLGVIHPNAYAFIPFQIRYRSLSPKTEEERDRFERILAMKLEMIWKSVLGGVIETNAVGTTFVESWMEILRGTTLVYSELNIFICAVYGEVFASLLQIFVSEVIRAMGAFEKKYDYAVTVDRLEPDAMLVGTLHKEERKQRFVQRLYDTDIQISAYRWDLGINIRRKYLWKKPWAFFVEGLM